MRVTSMEMGGNELLTRLTAAEASVNASRLVNRQLIEADWQRMAEVSERLRNATNFILGDSPSLTQSRIRVIGALPPSAKRAFATGAEL